jgi:probable rRNA maturation factor
VSARIKRAILKTCFLEGIKKPVEITVCLVRNSLIKELNRKFLTRNSPTDVMAFDFAEKKRIVADIVVSTDTALTNARLFKTTPVYELYLYVIHGMLHVLGYNDGSERKRKLMEKKATDILRILCPYKKPKH